MSDSWDTHYDGEIEGRQVTVQTYKDGGYRVKTNQGKDDEGTFEIDSSRLTHIPATSAARIVDIEEEEIEGFRTSLGEVGFTEAGIEKIISHFPK